MKRITFTVQDSKVATIVSLIVGDIEDLRVETIETTKKHRASPDGLPRTITARHYTKEGLEATALEDLRRNHKDGNFGIDTVRHILYNSGFNPTSASPLMTQLVRKGLAKKISRGVFELV